MTEQDPWATPPSHAAKEGAMRPAAPFDAAPFNAAPFNPAPTSPPPPVGYAQVPPPSYGAAVSTEKDWMGVTALVLSLATLLTGFTWIGGIIFGHLGLAAAKRGEASNRGMALAGTVIGWVFGGLAILAIVGFILAIMVFNISYD